MVPQEQTAAAISMTARQGMMGGRGEGVRADTITVNMIESDKDGRKKVTLLVIQKMRRRGRRGRSLHLYVMRKMKREIKTESVSQEL